MNDQETHSETTPVRRSRFLFVMKWVTILYLAGIVVYFGSVMYQLKRHRNLSDRMDIAIASLSLHCPPELTEDQWAFCILLTWNLDSGYGGSPTYVPTDDLERIVEEFETRIDAGPDLTTIRWLWDEYYRSYPRSRNYEKFWPTSPDNLDRFEAGEHGGSPLSDWRSMYEGRVRTRTGPSGL